MHTQPSFPNIKMDPRSFQPHIKHVNRKPCLHYIFCSCTELCVGGGVGMEGKPAITRSSGGGGTEALTGSVIIQLARYKLHSQSVSDKHL